jgi:hypothetical protein
MNGLPDAEAGQTKIQKKQLEKHYKNLARKLLGVYTQDFGKKDNPDADKVFKAQQKQMTAEEGKFYNLLLSAVDSQFLETWNNEVAKETLEVYLKDKTTADHLKAVNSKRGFFSSNLKQLSAEEQRHADEQYDLMVARVQAKQEEEIDPSSSKGIPQIYVSYLIGLVQVQLVDNAKDLNGLRLFKKNIEVRAHMYDASNYFNVNSIETKLTMEAFGVDCIRGNERTHVIKLNPEPGIDHFLDIEVKLGNKTHH